LLKGEDFVVERGRTGKLHRTKTEGSDLFDAEGKARPWKKGVSLSRRLDAIVRKEEDIFPRLKAEFPHKKV